MNWRNVARGVLLVLIAALVAVGFAGLFARQELYNTDRFVDTVSEISSEPEVQAAAAQRITTTIENEVNNSEAFSSLPGAVQILYQLAKPTLEAEIASLLAAPEFQTLWTDAIRVIHPQVKQVLQGKSSETLETVGNEIRVNVYPVYQEVANRLEDRGIGILNRISVTEEQFWVTIFEAERLVQIQDALRLINRLIFLALIVLPILAIVYLYLSKNRWRAAGWLCLTVVVGLILQRSLLALVRRDMLDRLVLQSDRDLAALFWDTIIGQLLKLGVYVGIVAAILAAIFLGYDYYRSRQSPQIQQAL